MIQYVHELLVVLAILLVGGPVAALATIAEHQWDERKLGRLAGAGLVPGLVKLTSGSQPGFPRRWRPAMTHLSPGRLDCHGRYLKRSWQGALIDVTAPLGWRRPSFRERMRLTASSYRTVIELQTPTATLAWAVPATRATWAVNQVLVRHRPRPADGWVSLDDP